MDFRRRPPVSDMSTPRIMSSTSFQIPNSFGSTSQMLLDNDCDDFLADMDPTLDTPVPSTSRKSRNANPLTLAELTPRTRRSKPTLRYTPSPQKSRIPSPLKQTTARGRSVAMDDTPSPPKSPPLDASFQIPRMGNDMSQLLMIEDEPGLLSSASDYSFLNSTASASSSMQAHDEVTLSRITPGE